MATATNSKYPLLGTHFVLDEEKILREKKYDLEKMYQTIDKIAKRSGMIKIDKNTYHCEGDENDLGCLGLFIHCNLLECDWFIRNVKEWQWISEREGDLDIIKEERENNNYIGVA